VRLTAPAARCTAVEHERRRSQTEGARAAESPPAPRYEGRSHEADRGWQARGRACGGHEPASGTLRVLPARIHRAVLRCKPGSGTHCRVRRCASGRSEVCGRAWWRY